MSSLDDKLRQRFGLQSFRPWQREAIEDLLDVHFKPGEGVCSLTSSLEDDRASTFKLLR